MSMIHDITARAPRNKRSQRKGRGESSGRGKTSGKGPKGAGARQGGPYWKRGHEGGQTAIFRRLPKRGFSNHDFERRFQLADYVVVTAADLADGLLSISLKRELPEALKPRRIEIGTGQSSLIESEKAA